MNKQTLLHTHKGLEAIELAKRLFFPETPDEAKKWASQWTSPQKKHSTLELYEYIPRKYKYYNLKFTIGDSVLSETLGQYNDAIKKFPDLKNLV